MQDLNQRAQAWYDDKNKNKEEPVCGRVLGRSLSRVWPQLRTHTRKKWCLPAWLKKPGRTTLDGPGKSSSTSKIKLSLSARQSQRLRSPTPRSPSVWTLAPECPLV